MKQLIKINNDQHGKQVVSARELYTFLGYDIANWQRWHTKNITKNQFAIEKVDYEKLVIRKRLEGRGNYQDFALTLDFAKRLSMLARTEQGEKIRKYFISCEEQLLKLKESAIFQQQISTTSTLLLGAPKGEYNHNNFIGDYDEYDIDVHVRRFIKDNINRWLTMAFVPNRAFFNEYRIYCKTNAIEPLKNVVVNHVLVNYCPKIGIAVNHDDRRAGFKGKSFTRLFKKHG